MSRLRETIRRERTELWKKQSWILRHDNAPDHTPYSPDLGPADFFVFTKLKTPMRGKRFVTIEEIKEKSKQELLAILKSAFQKCFEDWKKHWHTCIISEGVTLEGTR